MSHASNAARRYARALHEQASESGVVETIDNDMEALRDALEASGELQRFFDSPIISQERKKRVIKSLFATKVNSLTMELLNLLVEKKRESLVPEIVVAYRALRDAEEGIVEAVAQAAHNLSSTEQDQLRLALEGALGKQVRLRVEKNSDLVGGVVVRVGDTVYDRSVRRQLSTLRTRLERGTVLDAVNGEA